MFFSILMSFSAEKHDESQFDSLITFDKIKQTGHTFFNRTQTFDGVTVNHGE